MKHTYGNFNVDPSAGGWKYVCDAGTEWAPDHPVRSGEVPDAKECRAMTFGDFYRQYIAPNEPPVKS